MTGRFRAGVFGILVTALLLPAADASAALPVRLVDCGDVIDESIRLGNNLFCDDPGAPDDTALVVGANGITIDLNGYRISGSHPSGVAETDVGIDVNGHGDVTIRNGVIAGFDTGVRIHGIERPGSVRSVTFVESDIAGVGLSGGSFGHRITRNTFLRGGGVRIFDATANVIDRNTFYGARMNITDGDENSITRNRLVDGAIVLDGAFRNTIKGNDQLGESFFSGIDVSSGSTENSVVGNRVRGNAFVGISAHLSADNTFRDNTSTANGRDGLSIFNADGTSIVDNDLSANGEEGLDIDGASTGATVRGNRFFENGRDGFVSDAGALPDIRDNRALRNGYRNGVEDAVGLGINAADAALGSGSNFADANDVAAQCSLAICDSPTPPSPPPPLLGCAPLTAGTYELHNPLVCTTDGLKIGGDNVTIDLRIHRVGAEMVALRSDAASYQRLSVRGGVLAAVFGAGVYARGLMDSRFTNVTVVGRDTTGIDLGESSNGNTFERVLVAGNEDDGILVEDSDDNIFKKVTSASNGARGVAITSTNTAGALHSSRTRIVRGSVLGNGETGVDVVDADATEVSRSKVSGNLLGGVSVGGDLTGASSDSRVLRNKVTANDLAGVLVTGGADIEVFGNRVQANRQNGIVVGDSDTSAPVVERNRALNNEFRGIELMTSVGGARIVGNAAHGNGIDGILLSSVAAALTKNSANRNGFIGSLSPAPPEDDSGLGVWSNIVPPQPPGDNDASGNDNPLECVPAALC